MGKMENSRFFPAVICSAMRMTYEEVQEFLEGENKSLGNMPTPVCTSLRAAAALAGVLRTGRAERGSLDFELSEPEYSFDSEGRILTITRKERLFSHRLIEECMIAANEAVAKFLEERRLPVLFRVHPVPTPERLTALFRSLRMVEWKQNIPQHPSVKALPSFLRAAHGSGQEFFVGRLC